LPYVEACRRALEYEFICPLLAIQGYDDEYGTLAQLELRDCRHSPHRDQLAAVIAATRIIDRLRG
jgi:hypothetical protein